MKKEKVIDFGVLALRWYLIVYMFSYGFGKLTLSQFGVHDDSILDQPIKDIDSFYVTWHLFGRSVFFNIATGLLEVIGGILLIFNRTVLIGALLVLTILGQILVIDIAFTTDLHGPFLSLRIGGMILSVLVILYYYKDKIIQVWQSLTTGISTRFKYKWWVFLLLPIVGILIDFIPLGLIYPIKMLWEWIRH